MFVRAARGWDEGATHPGRDHLGAEDHVGEEEDPQGQKHVAHEVAVGKRGAVGEHGGPALRDVLPCLPEQGVAGRGGARVQGQEEVLVAAEGAAESDLLQELLRLAQEARVVQEREEKGNGH